MVEPQWEACKICGGDHWTTHHGHDPRAHMKDGQTMDALERINRLRMARDFAVQAENALLGLSMPRPHVGEQKALLMLGRTIAELGDAITAEELASKPHREGSKRV